jgi:hypothetical protein
MLDAHEGRVTAAYDISGAFLHAEQVALSYAKMTDDAEKLHT